MIEDILKDLPHWYIYVALAIIGVAGGGAALINRMQHTTCLRCARTLHKDKAVLFKGAVHMCEPCENIATYYDQFE